jgi:hypothetical protein
MIPAKYDPEELYPGVQLALECSDAVWYHSTLKSDLCGCRLSSEEESTAIDGVQCKPLPIWRSVLRHSMASFRRRNF